MKPQSAKQKGRVLQQHVAAALTEKLEEFGISEGDFRSISMGANGEDIILSPFAKKLVGDLRIECKNREALNVPTVFWEHAKTYSGKPVLLVSKRNHTKPLVTLTLNDYLELLYHYVKQRSSHQTTTV